MLLTKGVIPMRRILLNAHDSKLRSFAKLAEERLRKQKNLEIGEHALSMMRRFILSHIWSTSKKSTLYYSSSVAHRTCVPTLPVMKMIILTTGAEIIMEKENGSSHKQEFMRVSKTKFILVV